MKTQTTIRIEEGVLSRLKDLAKSKHRSLNNYLEYILTQIAGNEPNAETIIAIKEGRASTDLEEIKDITKFLNSI